MGTVHRASVNGNAMISGLHNCILLCMDTTAQLVHLPGGHLELLSQAAGNGAMRQIFRRTVVACSHNLLIFYDYSANTAAQAGRTLADILTDRSILINL